MQLVVHKACESVYWMYPHPCWTTCTGNSCSQEYVTADSLGEYYELSTLWSPGLLLSSLIPVNNESPQYLWWSEPPSKVREQEDWRVGRYFQSQKLFEAPNSFWCGHQKKFVSVLKMKMWTGIFTKICRSPARFGKQNSSFHSCDGLYLNHYFPLPNLEVQLNEEKVCDAAV